MHICMQNLHTYSLFSLAHPSIFWLNDRMMISTIQLPSSYMLEQPSFKRPVDLPIHRTSIGLLLRMSSHPLLSWLALDHPPMWWFDRQLAHSSGRLGPPRRYKHTNAQTLHFSPSSSRSSALLPDAPSLVHQSQLVGITFSPTRNHCRPRQYLISATIYHQDLHTKVYNPSVCHTSECLLNP